MGRILRSCRRNLWDRVHKRHGWRSVVLRHRMSWYIRQFPGPGRMCCRDNAGMPRGRCRIRRRDIWSMPYCPCPWRIRRRDIECTASRHRWRIGVRDNQRRHLVLFSLRMFRRGISYIRLLHSRRMIRRRIWHTSAPCLYCFRFPLPPRSRYIRSRRGLARFVRWDIAYIRLLHSRQMFLLYIIGNPFSLCYVPLRRGKGCIRYRQCRRLIRPGMPGMSQCPRSR